jgi:hypothetical protein
MYFFEKGAGAQRRCFFPPVGSRPPFGVLFALVFQCNRPLVTLLPKTPIYRKKIIEPWRAFFPPPFLRVNFMLLELTGREDSISPTVQFLREDYMSEEEVELRQLLSKRQYVAYLKSRSDADRGRSGFHGVAQRANGKWQSRITGVAVRIHIITIWLVDCPAGYVVLEHGPLLSRVSRRVASLA